MRYHTLYREDDAVVWVEADGSSGVIRATDMDAWADYTAWRAAGHVATPFGQDGPPMTLAQARDTATGRLNREVDALFATVLHAYPAAEAALWPEQLVEARAWTIDPGTATPLLDGIRAEQPLPDLVASVLVRAEDYHRRAGPVIAWRRACSDWIVQCEDIDALLAWLPYYPEVPGATH